MATKTYHKAQQMQTDPDALNAARRAIYCSINVTEKVQQATEQCTTWNELRKALRRILRTNNDCVIAYAEEK